MLPLVSVVKRCFLWNECRNRPNKKRSVHNIRCKHSQWQITLIGYQCTHFASQGAFWHRVGCKLLWGGVRFGVGGVHFQKAGVHQAISFSARSITSASEEALEIINEKQLKNLFFRVYHQL